MRARWPPSLRFRRSAARAGLRERGQAQDPERAYVLAAGDPRRPAIGRAVFAVLLAAAVFSVCTGPVKQIAPLYDHAPWLNDPFDTAVSFAMFFVPLIAACCLARVSLCRRSEPLPVGRVRDLLRGCRVLLAAAAVTLLSEWVSVAIGANRAQWDDATWLQVGLLALMTALTVRAAVSMRRVPALPLPMSAALVPGSGTTADPGAVADSGRAALSGAAAASGGAAASVTVQASGTVLVPDWLTDMIVIAARESRWIGPFQRPVVSLLGWIELRLLRVVRRHPLWAAGFAAGAFGLAAGARQGTAEGYAAPVTLTVSCLLSCGTFALLVAAGSYLGLVRSSTHLLGMRRSAVDAGVLTCAGVLVAFAFRYHLWWIVGSHNAVAGLTQLVALLGISALAVFVVVFALESLLHIHAPRGAGSEGSSRRVAS
jgi:hypothetical protein